MLIFHGLSFYLLVKNGGHHTNYLSGGPNLIPPNRLFCHLYMTYYLYEETQRYNAKKRRKEKCIIGAPAGIDSGSTVQHANHLATRSGHARLKITLHFGQIIRVSAIFVFANRV